MPSGVRGITSALSGLTLTWENSLSFPPPRSLYFPPASSLQSPFPFSPPPSPNVTRRWKLSQEVSVSVRPWMNLNSIAFSSTSLSSALAIMTLKLRRGYPHHCHLGAWRHQDLREI
ncbi:unnamed protein product [Cuscuta campestris]|uniref:Uncharacterized protein n=1 Tax=Cuscuta campestris TaxID=132261 RepID=A0A484N4B7_9ASTE|nr:unnamed protein product [Cuscuta campestris]